MVVALTPYSAFEIHSNSKVTSCNAKNNLLYVGFNNGQLIIYQVPDSTIDINDESDLSSVSLTTNQLEDLNIVNQLNLSHSITQIEFSKYLNYLVLLLSNQTIQIYDLNDYSLVDVFKEFRFNLVKTWSDCNTTQNEKDASPDLKLDEINEFDDEYSISNSNLHDTISLATSALTFEPYNTRISQLTTSLKSNSNYICLISNRNLIVLKWIQKKFSKKFEFKLNDKLIKLEFLNSNNLICYLKNGDLIKLNLLNSSINNIQIQYLNTIATTATTTSKSYFFSSRNNTPFELLLISDSNQFLILKDFNLIKLNNDLELIHSNSIDFKNPISFQNSASLKFFKYCFPYLILVYSNSVLELRSLENGSLIQTINLKTNEDIIDLKFMNKLMLVVTFNKIYTFVKVNYNYQLKQFEMTRDHNNAINLIEKLNPLLFEQECHRSSSSANNHHSPKQIKFLKLRKFQLLRGLQLLKSLKFESAFKLFIEYMASPDLVLNNLPVELSSLLNDDNDNHDEAEIVRSLKHKSSVNSMSSSISTNTIKTGKNEELINLLIAYLTDTRRKLIRLLDPDSPKFQWHGFLISIELYLTDDNETIDHRKLDSNLELIDNYLFQCYLLTNMRMIGPLLRIPNYCNFNLIVNKCLSLKLYSELIDFYYFKSKHEDALELLNKLIFQDGEFEVDLMVRYLQKLNNLQIDLIFLYSKKLIELDANNFELIFMNDSIECESLSSFKILEYLNENNWIDLQIKYLEYVVFELNDHNSKYSNKLIELYLIDINDNGTFLKIDKIYKLNTYNAKLIIKKLNSIETKENRPIVLRLLIDPLNKLKRYDEVLNLLVNELKDNDYAINNYCINIFNEDYELGNILINKLIDIYLINNDEPSIIKILNSNLIFQNPVNLLTKLPNDIELSKLDGFFGFTLRYLNTKLKEKTIINELFKINLIDLKIEKMEINKANVKLSAHSKCSVCDKTFNANSILSFYPNGQVIHYGCSKYFNN